MGLRAAPPGYLPRQVIFLALGCPSLVRHTPTFLLSCLVARRDSSHHPRRPPSQDEVQRATDIFFKFCRPLESQNAPHLSSDEASLPGSAPHQEGGGSREDSHNEQAHGGKEETDVIFFDSDGMAKDMTLGAHLSIVNEEHSFDAMSEEEDRDVEVRRHTGTPFEEFGEDAGNGRGSVQPTGTAQITEPTTEQSKAPPQSQEMGLNELMDAAFSFEGVEWEEGKALRFMEIYSREDEHQEELTLEEFISAYQDLKMRMSILKLKLLVDDVLEVCA